MKMKMLGIVLVLVPLVVEVYSGATLDSAEARGDMAELKLFKTAAAFSVESAVLLNDVAAPDKEIGYKIKASLHIAPLWTDDHRQYLLKFDLQSPRLHLRGKHISAEFLPHGSIWESHSESTFYAHWNRGSIEAVYLDPEDPLDILNYKKSLVNLFQFQTMDGEYNETDISGTCEIIYETISTNVFRKIKRRCAADAAAGPVVVSARRATRYTLEAGVGRGLAALHADELVTLGDEGGLGLKARSWVALQRLEPAPPAPPAAAASLVAALAALPPTMRALPLALAPPPAITTTTTTTTDYDPLDDMGEESVEAVIAEEETALAGEEPGEAGDAAAAAAVLRLVSALRAADRDALVRLLHDHAAHRLLPALCRALGLAAAPHPHHAAAHFLRLHTRDPLDPLARLYLEAVALAATPHEATVREVLRLGEEARSPSVARAALLAAAAAARRLPREDLQRDVSDALVRSLARCKDESCRASRLHALANLARADTADLLLEHAERGAAAALDALDALPVSALGAGRVRRLLGVALRGRAPLEVRAAALDLGVRRGAAHVGSLAWAARELAERAPRDAELRRVLWQRLEALGAARALAALLEPAAGGWGARAAGGTSSVVGRAAWAGGGWSSTLDSVQVAERGTLRRGRVRLEARAPTHDEPTHIMEVEVWTRGLDALAGGAAEGEVEGQEEVEGEGVAGGLAVVVAGARMSPVTLFSGQAELLGHVWSGTGSAPTRVTRAVVPLRAAAGLVPLAGGAVAAVEARGALALALDAAAHASLWWRSAHAALQLRAGAHHATRARLRTAWGAAVARADTALDTRLRIAADLDFYGEVALCARVSLDPYRTQRNVTLVSVGGARRLRVSRRRVAAWTGAGRTVALGRPNDAVCRTLRAAAAGDDADDADAL